MGTISKPNTFASGTTIASAEVNADFDTIYDEFNGNIENANIKAAAAIASSKLATVGVAQGGTGQTTLTKGDLLAASAATTLTKLGVGANETILQADSAQATGLAWVTVLAAVLNKDVTLGDGALVEMGAGTGDSKPIGKYDAQAGPVGTDADQLEKTLYTKDLPANSLNANYGVVELEAWGSFAANGNTKTVKLYFGATVLVSYSATPNAKKWFVKGTVVRTGAATQEGYGTGAVQSDLMTTVQVSPTEDTTGAITCKVTGQNGTSSANDIVANGFMVRFAN